MLGGVRGLGVLFNFAQLLRFADPSAYIKLAEGGLQFAQAQAKFLRGDARYNAAACSPKRAVSLRHDIVLRRTAMFRILILTVALTFALSACSKKEETGMDKAKESAEKAVDSAKDAAKEAGGAVKDAAKGAAEDVKEGTKEAVNKAADKAKDAVNK